MIEVYHEIYVKMAAALKIKWRTQNDGWPAARISKEFAGTGAGLLGGWD